VMKRKLYHEKTFELGFKTISISSHKKWQDVGIF
jgi:hypothetical protein